MGWDELEQDVDDMVEQHQTISGILRTVLGGLFNEKTNSRLRS
jgi:hypothetical protein